MTEHSIELTQSSIPSTVTIEAVDENGDTREVSVSGEHPLTLYVDKREVLTLMTLGANPEALILGWLRNQRLVKSPSEIAAIQVDWETESAAVTSRSLRDEGVTLWEQADKEAMLSKKTTTTGCGQGTVFGDLMGEIDNIHLGDQFALEQSTVYAMLAHARNHESVYKQAGAVHGCALCSNSGDNKGEILLFVEDVGRHNAVDTIAGLMWLNGMTGEDKIFYTTGRLTSEMVIKCAQMEIPALISRSGLTQMGFEIAKKLQITMLGRCKGKHFMLYTGQHRFIHNQNSSSTL